MFDHFLITRFNLRSAEWSYDKFGGLVLTDKWLAERFKIFQTFTLPSVINQSVQKFYWLIFFDHHTPNFYKNAARRLVSDYYFIRLYFIDGMEVFNQSIQNEISLIRDRDKYVITTRLDNDDSIHKDFIKTIQSLFKPIPGTLIDLRKGYQLNVQKKKMELRHLYDEFNHFISLIESGNEIKGVFSKQHYHWKETFPVLMDNAHSLFIEIVHKQNLMNSVYRKQPFVLHFNYNDFGLKPKSVKKASKFITIFYNRKYYYNRILSLLRPYFKFKSFRAS